MMTETNIPEAHPPAMAAAAGRMARFARLPQRRERHAAVGVAFAADRQRKF